MVVDGCEGVQRHGNQNIKIRIVWWRRRVGYLRLRLLFPSAVPFLHQAENPSQYQRLLHLPLPHRSHQNVQVLASQTEVFLPQQSRQRHRRRRGLRPQRQVEESKENSGGGDYLDWYRDVSVSGIHPWRKSERLPKIFRVFLRTHWQKSRVQSLRKDLEAHDPLRLQINSEKRLVLYLQGGHPQSVWDVYLRQTTRTDGQDQAVESDRHQAGQIRSHPRQPSLQVLRQLHRSFLLHLFFNWRDLPALQRSLLQLLRPPQHRLFPSRLHPEYISSHTGLCVLFEELLWNS